MIQKKSMARARIMNMTSVERRVLFRFRLRESRSVNGMTQWQMKSSEQMAHQPPWMRARYHGISSGTLPGPDDQELCEGEINVQHDKGKGELAQVMLFGRAQQGTHRLDAGELDDRQDAECEHGVALADEET